MWGSFYLGTVLNCDCVLRYFLGDLSSRTSSTNQTTDIELTVAGADSKKAEQAKSFLDSVLISPAIVIGMLTPI